MKLLNFLKEEPRMYLMWYKDPYGFIQLELLNA